MTLTQLGRSTALLIGTRCRATGVMTLTVTAATVRPIQLEFAAIPTAEQLQAQLSRAIPDELYFDDVHGTPPYRKHLTRHFAEEIRRELANGTPA
jgi:hypothetical protein